MNMPFPNDKSKIMHCSFKVYGQSMLLCDDANPNAPEEKADDSSPKRQKVEGGDEAAGAKPPAKSRVVLHIGLGNNEDVVKVWERAVKATGTKVTMELKEQFWGETYGMLEDPCGQTWSIGGPNKHKEAKKDQE